MNRRNYMGISSVLYFLCFVTAAGLLADAFELTIFSRSANLILDAVMVLSGYAASFFYCLCAEEKKTVKIMRGFLFMLFGFYIISLLDFTLIDENFGRNIFNFLSWDKAAFYEYINGSTNIIPFATVKLFIRGYFEDNLTLWDTTVNLIGNFIALMPLPFFTAIFLSSSKPYSKMLIIVVLAAVSIELLQFLLLTGSCDIDDVILNSSGAMLFYYLINCIFKLKIIFCSVFMCLNC